MATNKHAIIRYKELDRCLKNRGRNYTFEDLKDAVNLALSEFDSATGGIQTRQLREDIAFMKREEGYDAPIKSYREGYKHYYRYEDKYFSINNSPLSSTEAEQLKSALEVLTRVEGAPELDGLEEIIAILTGNVLNMNERKIMSKDSNIVYTGYKHIMPLFNAITNKRVLDIAYQPFVGEEVNVVFHPYYLKEYTNRWFILGLNTELNIPTWNFALDRIVSIKEVGDKYIDTDINWEDHFYDVIGVTVIDGKEPEEVELLFTEEQAKYIETKPIHGSQKEKYLESGELQVRLKVIPNYELETKLLSFGDKVKVIKPDVLVDKIRERLKRAAEQY